MNQSAPPWTKQYDGCVVGTIGGELKYNQEYNLAFLRPNAAVDTNPLILRILSRAGSVAQLRNLNAPSEIVEHWKSLVSETAEKLDDKLVRILLSGRLQMILLINSIGGRAGVSSPWKTLHDTFTNTTGQSRGG
jgi:hypothetical protein